MSLLESLLFGLLQGLFEWLPISSTGEIILAMVVLFDRAADEAVEMAFFLHMGTAVSAILYFRRDLSRILRGVPGLVHGHTIENRLVQFLTVSTIISIVLGYMVYVATGGFMLRGDVLIGVIGVALIVTGLVQRAAGSRGGRSETEVGLRDATLLGVVQAFSVIPGISRSGLTVSALLFMGYSPKDALRLSFLMGIPAILAAQAGMIALNGLPDVDPTHLAAGLAAASLAGYLAIGMLLRVAERVRFWLFAVIIGSLALCSYAVGLVFIV